MANSKVCRDRQTAFLPCLKAGVSCLIEDEDEDEEPGNTEEVIEISQERIATTTNHYRKTVAPVIMIIIDKHSIAAAIRDARFPNGYPIKEIAKQLELDAIAHLQAMGITEGTYTVKAGDLKYDIVEDKQGNPVIKAVKPRKSRRNA